MNLFFALCARMKDRGLENIQFSFEEIKELSDYKMTAMKAFVKDMDSLYSKMLQLTYREGLFGDDEGFRRFVLFTEFEVSTKKQTIQVSVNPRLAKVINGLTSEFSKFELSAFTSIRSTYAKSLFRLLMQYRSTGIYITKMDDFRELLDIPASYRMSNIDQTVLKPALNELKQYFKDLKIKKIKAKKGNKIDILEFTFSGLQTDLPKLTLHNWLED